MKRIQHDEELELLFASSPNNWIRNGNFIIFSLLIILLILSGFVKYPETVKGNVSLLISPSSATIVSKSSGRLKLQVKEGQFVKKGTLIGYIESVADAESVLEFSKMVDSLSQLASTTDKIKNNIPTTLKLGELESEYVAINSAISSKRQFEDFNNFESQGQDLKEQLTTNILQKQKLEENLRLLSSELQLIEKRHKRDSILYDKKVISLSELESSKLNLLPIKRNYQSLLQNIITTEGTIKSIKYKQETSNNDNNIGHLERNDFLKSTLLSSKAKIDLWKDRFLIISPFDGKVSLSNNWNSFQNVIVGDEILSLIPVHQGIIAKVKISAAGSGKLRIGARSIINLDDFPQEEFGTLQASVTSIPFTQTGNEYIVILSLSDGLKTNFDKSIPFKEGMTGSVRISTSNTSLLMRLFYQLRKALNEFM